MTRLVQAELRKLWTTRTARVLLALTAAGTAALVTLVLALAGRPGQPALGDDALRQLVLVPNGPLTLAALIRRARTDHAEPDERRSVSGEQPAGHVAS